MCSEWSCVWGLFLAMSLLAPASARHGVFRYKRHLQQEDSATVGNRFQHRSFSLETNWFNQTLDHFTESDTRTWQQRYWMRDTFYSPGGPVFLQLDGEWDADDRELTQGLIEVHATHFGALMFQLEHRFYGKSIPTSDLRVKNLQYLKVDQALGDAANFILAMQEKHSLPEDTKWIAFGGSYAGNVATWLRLKYPHLVYATVSSSAPLLAKLNFKEFLEETRDSLAAEGGEECVNAVREAVNSMEQLLLSSSGQQTLVKQFNLCGPINATSMLDRGDFFSAVGETLPIIVMDGSDSIKYFCSQLVNGTGDDAVCRYADAYNLYWDSEFEEDCINTEYKWDIRQMRQLQVPDETWNERQWMWQMCAELALFQTSETKDSLLGTNLPVRFYVQQCRDVFGKQFTRKAIQESVERTNRLYGGLDLNITRVLHVHGSLDPWRSLGITSQNHPECPVIIIPGASHCTWDQTPRASDPQPLVEGREKITAVIADWLKADSVLDKPQPLPDPILETNHLIFRF